MKKRLSLLALLGVTILACSLPLEVTFNPLSEENTEALVLTVEAQAIAMTVAANTQSAAQVPPEAPPAAQDENAPVAIPTASLAATPTQPAAAPDNAAASNKPMISVSIDTNCRTGPGQDYDIVGALLAGETAEVVGKNSGRNYWIITNPDNPSHTCWLWGQYATVSGDQSGLAEISIPPTPTLSPTASPTPPTPIATTLAPSNPPSNFSGIGTCRHQQTDGKYLFNVALSWADNSNNEEGFKLWMLPGPSSHTNVKGLVADYAPNTTFNAFDIAIAGDARLYFQIESYNTAGSSQGVSLEVYNDCSP